MILDPGGRRSSIREGDDPRSGMATILDPGWMGWMAVRIGGSEMIPDGVIPVPNDPG